MGRRTPFSSASGNTIDGGEIMVVAEIRDCVVNLALGGAVKYVGTLAINRGVRTALIGPNGAGKTTMLLLLSGLTKPDAGTASVFGAPPNIRSESFRRNVGLLLQHPDDQLLAPTVRQDVALSLRALRLPEKEVQQRTSAVLEELGIIHLAERAPHHLSGGEKKLVAVAGAMIHRPELLLLDEPFAGLDGSFAVLLVEALQRFAAQGGAVVISSHEVGGIDLWADQVYIVRLGVITGPLPVAAVVAECRQLRPVEGGFLELPAVYSRLVVERFGASIAKG